MTSSFHVILTGTDPASGLGGVSVALQGTMAALDQAGLPHTFFVTHRATTRSGKFWPWLQAMPRVFMTIRRLRRQGVTPVLYGHAGAALAIFRQGCLMVLGRLAGARTMIQLHAPEVAGYLRHPIKRFLFKIALVGAERVCVLTPWWREQLERAGVRGVLRVVPNPLPGVLEVAARTPRVVGDAASITVLCMTRLIAGKGVDDAIAAMAHLPESFRLIVAGDGPLIGALREQARGLGSRVHFAGWVAGEEKERLYREADIFLLPTRNDSFGMGFVEAMAHGVPVVAWRWEAIPDVVPEGRAGLLVGGDDPGALARAVVELADPERRRGMATAGQWWVLESYGSARLGERLADLMRELTAA